MKVLHHSRFIGGAHGLNMSRSKMSANLSPIRKHPGFDFSKNLALQSTLPNEAQLSLISTATGSTEHSCKSGFRKHQTI